LLGPVEFTGVDEVANMPHIEIDHDSLGVLAPTFGDVNADGLTDLVFYTIGSSETVVTVVFGQDTIVWPAVLDRAFVAQLTTRTITVPESIIGLVSLPLQAFATKVSAGIIQACSIPVLREGNMLYFVQTQLEVAEACSGIRSIVAITMLSTVFVYLSKGRLLQKIIILCSAIPVALLANILRVSGTGILAHFYGDQVARGFLHDFSGLAVFVFGMLILFFEYMTLNKLLNNSKLLSGKNHEQ
jgi:exosortase